MNLVHTTDAIADAQFARFKVINPRRIVFVQIDNSAYTAE